MSTVDDFWQALDELVATSEVRVDRPGGSSHPRHAEVIYPLDYGFLNETTGGDGDGVDIWLGTAGYGRVTGAVVTVDPGKRDSEVNPNVTKGSRRYTALLAQ